jgi:hypothetical protein
VLPENINVAIDTIINPKTISITFEEKLSFMLLVLIIKLFAMIIENIAMRPPDDPAKITV